METEENEIVIADKARGFLVSVRRKNSSQDKTISCVRF